LYLVGRASRPLKKFSDCGQAGPVAVKDRRDGRSGDIADFSQGHSSPNSQDNRFSLFEGEPRQRLLNRLGIESLVGPAIE
jgi:hypothetical protein